MHLSATDPDSTDLDFSATGLPTGLSITQEGLIQGTIANGSAGSYAVEVTVSDGQSSDTDSFRWSVNPPNQSCGGLIQEAEGANLFGSMLIGTDASASGGQFVSAPLGSGSFYSEPSINDRAEFCITIETTGIYRISTLVKAQDSASDSFYVSIDGQPEGGYLWDTSRSESFTQDFVQERGSLKPVEIMLNAGDHIINFFVREENTQLDSIKLELVNSGPPQNCLGLSQEAESGDLSGNLVIANDAAASGGQYVYAPAGAGFIFSGAGNDKASFCVTVTQPGDYRIKASVYGADGGQDSFYVTVNGQPNGGYLWDFLRNTTYASDFVSDRSGSDPVVVNLTAGDHVIAFHQREDESRLDKFELERVNP